MYFAPGYLAVGYLAVGYLPAAAVSGTTTAAPVGIASGEAFGVSAITIVGTSNLSPLGIASGEVFGVNALSIATAFAPLGILSTEAFGVSAITFLVAPTITSSLNASGQLTRPFSYQISGDNSPTSYNATGLPLGLSINTSTGVISGTATAIATTSVTISATNAIGTGNATLTLSIGAFRKKKNSMPTLSYINLSPNRVQVADTVGDTNFHLMGTLGAYASYSAMRTAGDKPFPFLDDGLKFHSLTFRSSNGLSDGGAFIVVWDFPGSATTVPPANIGQLVDAGDTFTLPSGVRTIWIKKSALGDTVICTALY